MYYDYYFIKINFVVRQMSAKNFQQLILQDNCTDIKNCVFFFNLIRVYVCECEFNNVRMRFFTIIFVFFLQIIFFFLVHPFNTILGSAKARNFVIIFKIEFIVIR